MACYVTFAAADGFLLGFAASSGFSHVSAGGFVVFEASENNGPQGPVGVTIPATIESV